MPRIRSIKPEFPQSESMGRVSRESRLLFVLLWTLCDDFGRSRASSRMLASLLFPYDGAISTQIDEWLRELERENCITLYEVGGSHYLQVVNWDKHQKVDHPSKSGFPAPSTYVANPREDFASCHEKLALDQGPRTKDRTKDRKESEARASRLPDDWKLTPDLVEFARHQKIDPDATLSKFRDYWRAAPGAKGRKLDWAATWRNWCRREAERVPTNGTNGHRHNGNGTGLLPETPWPQRIALWRKNGNWPLTWGPKPGDSGCQAPKEFLT